jgi:hypothetical protein
MISLSLLIVRQTFNYGTCNIPCLVAVTPIAKHLRPVVVIHSQELVRPDKTIVINGYESCPHNGNTHTTHVEVSEFCAEITTPYLLGRGGCSATHVEVHRFRTSSQQHLCHVEQNLDEDEKNTQTYISCTASSLHFCTQKYLADGSESQSFVHENPTGTGTGPSHNEIAFCVNNAPPVGCVEYSDVIVSVHHPSSLLYNFRPDEVVSRHTVWDTDVNLQEFHRRASAVGRWDIIQNLLHIQCRNV